jgi:hypothetical protein
MPTRTPNPTGSQPSGQSRRRLRQPGERPIPAVLRNRPHRRRSRRHPTCSHFLTSTYEAAAEGGHWNRAELEVDPTRLDRYH